MQIKWASRYSLWIGLIRLRAKRQWAFAKRAIYLRLLSTFWRFSDGIRVQNRNCLRLTIWSAAFLWNESAELARVLTSQQRRGIISDTYVENLRKCWRNSFLNRSPRRESNVRVKRLSR